MKAHLLHHRRLFLELVGLEVRDALGGGGGVGGAREGEKREEREDVVDAGHDVTLRAI